MSVQAPFLVIKVWRRVGAVFIICVVVSYDIIGELRTLDNPFIISDQNYIQNSSTDEIKL